MSGGHLVVMDRSGRDVKRYELASGLVTLGSHPACDIRVMLPMIAQHHATVCVHANRTVVRAVAEGATLVNGAPVSVHALAHGDVLTLGDRRLRWEYARPPAASAAAAAAPALFVATKGRKQKAARGRTRASEAASRKLDPAVHLMLEMKHRASMPGGAKQVAVVQPQRRDPNAEIEVKTRSATKCVQTGRRRAPPPRPAAAAAPETAASRWIASRKRGAPAPGLKVAEPEHMDKNKKVALMILTRSPKPMSTPMAASKAGTSMSFMKKATPITKTPQKSISRDTRSIASTSKITPVVNHIVTPKRISKSFVSNQSRRSSKRIAQSDSVSIFEITDSDEPLSKVRRTSGSQGSDISSLTLSSRKSALKSSTQRNKSRKSESIKFDLSNLESRDDSVNTDGSYTSEDLSLHYSDTSQQKSPPPEKSVQSRSSRILNKSIGGSPIMMTNTKSPSTRTPTSTRKAISNRSSIIVQKALDNSIESSSSYDSLSTSRNKTKGLSPKNNMESYSIVDLVSLDSNNTGTSVYDSVGSTDASISFATPNVKETRLSRSGKLSIVPTIIGSSTPYVGRTSRAGTRKVLRNVTFTPQKRSVSTPAESSINSTQNTTRRSKSLSTPLKMGKAIVISNPKRPSRRGDSVSLVLSRYSGGDNTTAVIEDSPKTSKKSSRLNKTITLDPVTPQSPRTASNSRSTPASNRYGKSRASEGPVTPENTVTVEEAGTPMLKIQKLLDSSHSPTSRRLQRQSSRKTIGGAAGKHKPSILLRNAQTDVKRKSGRKSVGLNLSNVKKVLLRRHTDDSGDSNKTDENAPATNNEENVTPKSTVKLVPEAVKHQHSTAKKPMSKRTIIDDLNESDIVKQLFNSPVKRRLSRSMIEFRNNLSDDEATASKKRTRRTIALTSGTPNETFDNVPTPTVPTEVFVSPLNTPAGSPNLVGIKKLLGKTTPRNVKIVKALRTPRSRKSPRNDLTNVSGVRAMFREAKTPRNDLTDVRGVKELFAGAARNDLRRVSGVKSLFNNRNKRTSPRNDLNDVRGVKGLFRQSPRNDLSKVQGVKKTLSRNSPRNDLRDVRGVKRIFRQEKAQKGLEDLSGVEELFDVSHNSKASDLDATFDLLVGKPVIKATYSKSLVGKNTPKKPKSRGSRSLAAPVVMLTNNVEDWLEQELERRVHKDVSASKTPKNKAKNATNKVNLTRELQKLTMNTVEGKEPIRTSRIRVSTINKSRTMDSLRKSSSIIDRNSLPLKKRSIIAIVKEANDSNTLPIKKRVIVHSTPLKGKRGVVVATELGRVSPITLETSDREPTAKSPEKSQNRSTIVRGKRGARNKQPQLETTKPISPKGTLKSSRASVKRKADNSPVKRNTRSRRTNADVTQPSNTKKRKSSLVITKKTPKMSPVKASPVKKRGRAVKNVNNTTPAQNKSPVRITRGGRKTQAKAETPKTKTRAQRKRKSDGPAVVIGKASPSLKPQTAKRPRGGKDPKENVPEVKKTRKPESPKEKRRVASKRKQTTIQESEIKSPKTRRGRTTDAKKVEFKDTKVSRKAKSQAAGATARKTKSETDTAKANKKVAEAVRSKRSREIEEEVAVKKTRRNVKSETEVAQPRGRSKARAAPATAGNENKLTKAKETINKSSRSRPARAVPEPTGKETRAKKNVEKSSPVRATRGAAAAAKVSTRSTKQRK